MVALERLQGEAGLPKRLLLRGGQRLHVVIETGNQHPTGPGFHTRADHLHQLRQWIADHPTGDTRVEVGGGSAERQHKWLHATQTGRAAGLAARDPHRVGDDDRIGSLQAVAVAK